MILHPRILCMGDQSSRWTGLAKKWARQSYAAGIRNKTWAFNQVTIRVENYPELGLSKVWIAAGAFLGYQFFGSEARMLKTVADPFIPGRYWPVGNWTLTKFRPVLGDHPTVALEAAPVLSSYRMPAQDEWPFDPNPVESEKKPAIDGVHQPDGMGVKVWRNPRRPARWLAHAWVEPTPFHAAYRSGGGGLTLPESTDRGYDIPPTVFSGTKGSVQVPDMDWHRGACLHRAESPPYPARTFVIAVDIAQTFHCCPAGADEPLPDDAPRQRITVAPKYVKSQPAPLPGWVTRFDVGRHSKLTPLQHFRAIQPLWEFSPNGDRAASVQFERAEPWQDDRYTSSRYTGNGVKAWDIREDWPGVVEVAFDVTITGENPEDFNFRASTTQVLHSRETGRGFLAVGYAGRNFPELPGEVKHNDLLILEHRYYLGPLWQRADAYDAPEQGHAVGDPQAHVLQPPPMLAIAAITCRTTDVLAWLSAYVARKGRFDPFAAGERISPEFDALADKPANPPALQMLSVHTAIHSLHLPTLSLVLGTSATLTGICDGGLALPDEQTLIQWGGPFCAAASSLTLYSLGVVEERKEVGHPQMRAALQGYLDLSDPVLDVKKFKRIDLRATADQDSTPKPPEDAGDLYQTIRYRPWPFSDATDHPLTELQFATVTLRPGPEGEAAESRPILHAMMFAHWRTGQAFAQPNLYGNPLIANPLFPDRYYVLVPTLFTLFDANWHVRPGIRWVKSDGDGPERDSDGRMIVQPGNSSFSGYPVGLVLHARFAMAALWALNNPMAQISAEAGGSYAVFVGPVAAPKAVIATHPNIDQPEARLDSGVIGQIEQMTLDVIRPCWTHSTAGALQGKTSHVEQMNAAFGINLRPEDYHFRFSLSGGQLRVTPETRAPAPLPAWRVHHDSDYDRQWYNGVYGGAAIFSPVAIGQVKTCYVNSSGGAVFAITLPTLNEVSLFGSATPAMVAFPTPRMEGLFTPLPWKEETA